LTGPAINAGGRASRELPGRCCADILMAEGAYRVGHSCRTSLLGNITEMHIFMSVGTAVVSFYLSLDPCFYYCICCIYAY